MDLDQLTIGEVKQLQSLIGGGSKQERRKHDFEVGKSYFIRSVTHHLLGHAVVVLTKDLCYLFEARLRDKGGLVASTFPSSAASGSISPN